jgi:hypothetical protein
MTALVTWWNVEFARWIWHHSDDCSIMAEVDRAQDGTYEARWTFGPEGKRYVLSEFQCVYDACMALEKRLLAGSYVLNAWFESKRGGSVSLVTRSYVRRGCRDWYAVRQDGTLLAQNGIVSWFRSPQEAFKAVHRQRHTPIDYDPFAPAEECWAWIELPDGMQEFAAELRSRRCRRSVPA